MTEPNRGMHIRTLSTRSMVGLAVVIFLTVFVAPHVMADGKAAFLTAFVFSWYVIIYTIQEYLKINRLSLFVAIAVILHVLFVIYMPFELAEISMGFAPLIGFVHAGVFGLIIDRFFMKQS